MTKLRNVSFVLMVALFAMVNHAGVFAFEGCSIEDGYNTTTVTGTCQNSCAEFFGVCEEYCDYLSGYYQMSCEVWDEDCQEYADPPPASAFSCSCLCW